MVALTRVPARSAITWCHARAGRRRRSERLLRGRLVGRGRRGGPGGRDPRLSGRRRRIPATWWPPRISTSTRVTISPINRITSRRGRRTAAPTASARSFTPTSTPTGSRRFSVRAPTTPDTAGSAGTTSAGPRSPTGCGNARSTRSTSWASPPIIACAGPRKTRREQGLATRVLVDLTAGVGEESTAAAIEALRAAGVAIVASP